MTDPVLTAAKAVLAARELSGNLDAVHNLDRELAALSAAVEAREKEEPWDERISEIKQDAARSAHEIAAHLQFVNDPDRATAQSPLEVLAIMEARFWAIATSLQALRIMARPLYRRPAPKGGK